MTISISQFSIRATKKKTETNMLRAASFKLVAFRGRNAFANPLHLLPRRRFCVPPAFLQARRNEARTKLFEAFDYEIELNQMIPSRPEAPADFPFKLQHLRHQEITLTRELAGEKTEVTLFKNDENQNDSDSDSDFKLESPPRSVPVRVVITKSNGKSMRFAAAISADVVLIQRVTTKDGEDNVICSQLYIEPESELQVALRELLATRGIGKSIGGFVYNYMSWSSTLPCYAMYDTRYIDAIPAGKWQEKVEILEKLKKVIEEW